MGIQYPKKPLSISWEWLFWVLKYSVFAELVIPSSMTEITVNAGAHPNPFPGKILENGSTGPLAYLSHRPEYAFLSHGTSPLDP